MEDASARARLPSRKGLESYASAYLGAYMNAIEREKPEHMPALARNLPYKIDVCIMPNQSFVLMFQRADSQEIAVHEKDWGYVESAVLSGVSHLVTVYAHEGPTVADAIAKGKKDAVRDMRSLDHSGLAKATLQLEKFLDELAGIEKGNKNALKLADAQLQRLQPIRQAVMNAGPEVDMLAMVDALRNYPSARAEVNLDDKEKELLESMCKELGDLADVIRRIEAQDQELQALEQSVAKGLSEFGKNADDKIGKGLAMVLSSSDRKIDKALSEIQAELTIMQGGETPKDLEARFAGIEAALAEMSDRRQLAKEMVLAVADVRENMGRLGQRVTRIEQILTEAARQKPAPPK